MKIFKSKIGLIIALILIFGGFIFSSEIVYFSELIGTVYKIQRTEADITDYKYFDNVEITNCASSIREKLHVPDGWYSSGRRANEYTLIPGAGTDV